MTTFRVALTFDAEHPDRPTVPGVAESIIETLAARDVRATFFVQGRWAEAYPATAGLIAPDGHLVGSHSHYHVRMPLLSEPGFDEDVRTAEDVIRGTTGVDPRPWFRCPFGAGAGDARILAALGELGYRHVGWDVAAEDWEPSRTGAAIADDVVSGVLARGDGAIVLLHTWPIGTRDALVPIVERLGDAGATFVRVDDLPFPPRASVDG